MLGMLEGTRPLCTPCVVNVADCQGTFAVKSSEQANSEFGGLAGDYGDVDFHSCKASEIGS
jgi:hypothetical protein